MHLTRRRSPIDIHDSWVHVTSIGGDVDSNWRFKSLPSTPFSTPPDEKELEEMFKVAKDSTVCQPIVIPPRNDDLGRPRGDLPQLIGPESSTLPKAGGNRPLHAHTRTENHEINTLPIFFYIPDQTPHTPVYNPPLPMFGRWKSHRPAAKCGPKALASSVIHALALANGIAAAIAQPDFKLVIGKAPPEPAPEASPTSPRSPGRTMSWQLLSPVTDQRMSLPPIQIPPLDNSSSPGTPVSDEIPTPSSANAHGVVVSPVLESPLSERLQDYIAAYLSTIPLENMRTLETILEDEDDDDSDAQSEHTIVPRDKEKIPDTPVTRSSIYSFHTANASIITSPVSPSESDWPRI